MKRRRKIVVLAAVAASLVAAGVAGAVARYTIIVIKDGRYARLSNTSVYCQNSRNSNGRRSLLCGVWVGTKSLRRPVGTYGALINERGVGVYRVTGPRTVKSVDDYVNP